MFVHADQVCEWHSPEQLKDLLDLELRDGGESESKILQRCRDAIRYSVKTSKSSNVNELRLKIFLFSFFTPKCKSGAQTECSSNM